MTQIISKLKKVGFLVVALSMLLPFAFANSTFAEECDGPTDISTLQTALDNHTSSIVLCGNVTGTFTVTRAATINLNGYSIASAQADQSFARADGRQASLTITGKGNVSGRISNSFTTRNFVVQGGTWAIDPSRYVHNPYAAYHVGDDYVVETRITANNFTVSPAEIVVRKGETAQITVNKPEDSTTGVDFAISAEGVVEIDETGQVTTVDTGKVTVTVSPTYDERIKKEVSVAVYAVEPLADSSEEMYESEEDAAENLVDLIDSELPVEDEVSDKLKDAFSESEAEAAVERLQDSMASGSVINTIVSKEQARLTDDERSQIAAEMGDVSQDNIKFFDVNIEIKDDDTVIGNLHTVDKPIRVYLVEVENPADGYSREYYVVSYHDNTPRLLEEGTDYEIVDNKIYLTSKEFSVFAVGYKDTEDEPEEEEPTEEEPTEEEPTKEEPTEEEPAEEEPTEEEPAEEEPAEEEPTEEEPAEEEPEEEGKGGIDYDVVIVDGDVNAPSTGRFVSEKNSDGVVSESTFSINNVIGVISLAIVTVFTLVARKKKEDNLTE